jgi:hypothetical protein
MFDRLLRAAVDTVTLPILVAADVVTLGGALVDRKEPYTVTKARRLGNDALDVVKTLAD